MDVRRLLAITRKWFALLVAGVALASGAAFAFSTIQQETYEAGTKLIVGQSLSSLNPDYTGLLASQQLSTTYAAIVTTRPLVEAVIGRLDLDTTADQLLKRIRTETTPGSPLLVISAQDTEPDQAAAIANALAEQLIAETSVLQGRQETVQASVEADLMATRAQITATQDRIAEILALEERTPAQVAELGTLEDRLVSLRATAATLLSYAATSATNLLSVVEPAEAPADAISPRPLLNVLVAAVLGFMIALGIALLAEYMRDSVSSPDEVEAVSGYSTVGAIGKIKGVDGNGESYELVASLHPRAAITEAYRRLRTNLDFAAVDTPNRSLLVTSARAGEGKTVTASNIAIVYAQSGRRVLLVDADLRLPRVHLAFGLVNKVGLTSVLVADRTIIDGFAHATATPNLSVVPSGPLPPNPAELLGSHRMRSFLEAALSAYDLVVLDSPPLQGFADAAVLSSMMDGTLLVVDASRSRRRAVKQAGETLARAGANVVGVVLNRASGPEYADHAQQYGSYFTGIATPVSVESEDASRPVGP